MTALKAVVPMKAGKVVGDSVVDPGQLTSLLLHFADETVTQVALEFLGEYKQTNISEHQFANGLLYTPYQLGGAWNDLLHRSRYCLPNIGLLCCRNNGKFGSTANRR